MKKIPEYCVTNEADYLNRRAFIKKSECIIDCLYLYDL
jgi:hypothetical protein